MVTEHQQHSDEMVSTWVDSLGPGVGTDTLLRFAPSVSNSIDITHAHPSGLAQFLAGRRTRLSTLLRDSDAYDSARRTADALRSKIRELWDERGIDVGYLSAGLANWRAVHEGRSEQFNAPIMLGRIVLSVRDDQDDFEIQLMGRAEFSPALLRYFKRQHRLEIDTEAINSAAYSIARFDPTRAMDALRSQVAEVSGMVVAHRLLISTFADLADPADPGSIDLSHPVLGTLFEKELNRESADSADSTAPGATPSGTSNTTAAKPAATIDTEPRIGTGTRRKSAATHPRRTSDDRDPADELLLLDADESQQAALDLIEAGESVAISAPAGSGQTQTALNAAAVLAAKGKRVLVVAERRSTAEEFVARFDELELAGTALLLSPEDDPDELRKLLTRAILRNERATEPSLGKLHAALRDHRHALLEHVHSLHSTRARWGCSPYQAMQELARLTSLTPAPATTVRLKRSVLDSITNRATTAAKLKRAAELGAFIKASESSPWYGARLRNKRDTDTALDLVSGLQRDLPILRDHMLKVAAHSEIRLADSYNKWGEQLDLLVAVRSSLDKFESDIFDKSVEDLISATASSSWRRERGIEMSSMTRSRLRKVAKDYVRPGVHVADLQTALEAVQEQHLSWHHHATSQRHPMVPAGLLDVNAGYQDAGSRLDKLAMLLPAAAGERLRDEPIAQLLATMSALLENKGELDQLPERTLITEQLAEHGLSELIDDFRARNIAPDAVGSELDLAWWQSALEAMISGDDFLAMNDGEKLRKLEAEYRLADSAHVSSGASRLRWALAKGWKAALADHRAASRELRALLKDGEPAVADLMSLGDSLLNSLCPIWVGSPLLIPAIVPADLDFDAVILLDADSLSLRSVLGSISRSKQVIAFGDTMMGAPHRFEVSVDPTAHTRVEPAPISAMESLAGVLPLLRFSTAYRGIDEGLTESLSHDFYAGSLSRLPAARSLGAGQPALKAEYVPDGTGSLGLDGQSVQTTVAEVQRVVDLVFAHLARRGEKTLAVVAGNRTHASAIAEGIRVQLPNHPWAAKYFRTASERFVVTSIDKLAGMQRDAIILSLGYGRTTHGKIVHDFGALSAPGGDELFVNAVTRARESMVLVSALRPQDMDLARLRHGAHRFLELVGRVLGGDSGMSATTTPLQDPLVTDLMTRLADRGAIVTQHYRGVLDIAAHALDVTGNGTAAPLAVVYDGTQGYRKLTVRERSRLRPQLFEALGWRYVPLWTIDVFSDPDRVANMLAGFLGLDGSTQESADAVASGQDKNARQSKEGHVSDGDSRSPNLADA
ncbi:putative DNA helicase [Paeniglutamicibacter gangotriensis]|uniref:Putative DNA helicase n=1 Tax=Paeniglutamicibacter gangotriensis Lz1y TaxID=1276920 RepID=M7NCP9_9MICC|nr:putative DNA helicase [Paeniglutamicibacter gangotriensis]EMQ99594.1 putative DNA helicase [Paeniglutamicibacter gangotriensis Lz1y]